jgi:hypothetical protein
MNILELEADLIKARESVVVKDLESKLNPQIKSIGEHKFSCLLIKKVEIYGDGNVGIEEIHGKWVDLNHDDFLAIANAKGYKLTKIGD